MTGELDIHDCVYCGQPLDAMPSLRRGDADGLIGATYHCVFCESNFTLYFDEDENGVLTKI